MNSRRRPRATEPNPRSSRRIGRLLAPVLVLVAILTLTVGVAVPDSEAQRTASEESRESRHAFADLTGARAIALGRETFKSALAAPVMRTGLEKGETVEKYLGDFAAKVSTPGASSEAVIESTIPLRTVNEEGRKAPVQLALEDEGGHLESRNPLVSVRFAKDPREGVTLEKADVGVRLVGTSPAVRGREAGDRLVVPEALRDTDYWAAPTQLGFQTFAVLRSAASPEQLVFEVDVPVGAKLRPGPAGAAAVVRGEDRIASISAPVASDAEGAPVAVSMSVSGNRLIIDVPHRDRNLTYPLLVDPVYEEEDWEWIFKESPTAEGWTTYTNHSGSFNAAPLFLPGRYFGGLYIFTINDAFVSNGDYTEWRFDPPGTTTKIYRTEMEVSTNALNGCYALGISDGQQSSGCGELEFDYFVRCAVESCDPTKGGAGNLAFYRIGSNISSERTEKTKLIGALGFADVRYSENDVPSFAAVNSGGTSGWQKSFSGEITGSVRDDGMGMGVVQATITGSEWVDGSFDECLGTSFDPCPAELSTGYPISSEELEDGKHQVVLEAWDAVGQHSSTNWGQIWLDRGSPSVEGGLSGDLWDNSDKPNGEGKPQAEAKTLSPGVYGLKVTATDGAQGGAESAQRSGVKSIEITVDGETVLPADSISCPGGSCPHTREWSLDTGDFSPGEHTVGIIVRDQLNHVATKAFHVKVPVAGEIDFPAPDAKSSRWLQLKAHADTEDFSTVRFQARKPSGTWANIPLDALTSRSGQPLESLEHPLESNKSPMRIWEVAKSFDPPLDSELAHVEVRAIFSGENGKGTSNPVKVMLDQRGLTTDDAVAPIGPGNVNLATGNFSFTETDATLATWETSIPLTRTFNSRNPDINSDGPFGPGWTASVPVEGAAEYAKLTVTPGSSEDDIVELETSIGTSILFFRQGEQYIPEPGFESLFLEKSSASAFVLEDSGGTSTTFAIQKEDGNVFAPGEVRQPGWQNISRAYYQGGSNTPKIIEVVGPAPLSVSCGSPLTTPGCRTMTIHYAWQTTATGTKSNEWGEYSGRARAVKIVAADPETEEMQAETIAEYSYDSNGRLRAVWDPRISPALKTTYTYDEDGRLEYVYPPGQTPWQFHYEELEGDGDGGRLQSVQRSTSTTTVSYGVPLSGEGAPHAMAPSDLETWGQTDTPVGATAIFPPDDVPSDPPADYDSATVYYLNPDGREVNNAATGAGISTTEYDAYGNAVRELSPANRARALAAGEESSATAQMLDTQRVFASKGTELTEELGPEREVQLENGETVRARARTTMSYDEGAPDGTDPHLPTLRTTQAKVTGGSESADARVTKTEYNWDLQKPVKIVKDYGGLNLTERWTYNGHSGLVLTHYGPKEPEGTPQRETLYYSASGGSFGRCNYKPYWANLPCEVRQQHFWEPSSNDAGLPDLGMEWFEYDREHRVVRSGREGDHAHQVTTNTYDGGGRMTSQSTEEQDPDAGLVAAYGFEGEEEWYEQDVSGNNNTGFMLYVDRTPFGRFGKAARFNSGSDAVLIADSESLELEEGTFEAWVKPSAIGSATAQKVIERPGGGGYCSSPVYALRASTSAGEPEPRVSSCGGNKSPENSTILRNGAWSHLVATIDKENYVKIYVNGERVMWSALGHPEKVGTTLILGEGFSGLIDEVRIYNRALSQAEVRRNMLTPVDPEATDPELTPREGLASAFGFEENPFSSELVDASGSLEGSVPRATRTVGGAFGGGLEMEPGKYVETVYDESAPAYDPTNGFTIEGWFEFNSVPNEPAVILSRCGSLHVEASPGEEGSLSVEADSAWAIAFDPVLEAGKPAFIAITNDNKTLRVYINGTLVASGESYEVFDSGCPFKIGNFDGALDEIRVYNRALSVEEIQEDSQTPVTQPVRWADIDSEKALPSVHHTYDEGTGFANAIMVGEEVEGEFEPTETLLTYYDSLGRVNGYEDSLGNSSGMIYDVNGRVATKWDGYGTRTFDYEEDSGLLTGISHSSSAVGDFTASYDETGQLMSQTYPNGMVQSFEHDETGTTVGIEYTKEGCLGCVWFEEDIAESIHGQWTQQENSFGDFSYDYDGVGRLTKVGETPDEKGCTTRTYTYDAASNRLSRTERVPGGEGACAWGGGGQSQTSEYDRVSRAVDEGFIYDSFNRITEVPESHSGGGPVALTYHANDLTHTAAQDGKSIEWLLDPLQTRPREAIANDGTRTLYQYGNESDAPAGVVEMKGEEFLGARWNIAGIDGSLAGILLSDGVNTSVEYQLTNLHGDIVGTASDDPEAGEPAALFRADEFGQPTDEGGTDREYGWLGGKHRRTVLDSGLIQMGVRSYVPAMGRFTSVDPVYGGSANSYDYANADPLNQLDLDGRAVSPPKIPGFEQLSRFIRRGARYVLGNVNLSPGRLTSGCVNGVVKGIGRLLGGKILDAPWKALWSSNPLKSCPTGAAQNSLKNSPFWTDMRKLANKYKKQFQCGEIDTRMGCWRQQGRWKSEVKFFFE